MLNDATKLFYQPVIAFFGAVSVVITIYVVWLTFHDISLMRPGQERFIGLDNYLRLLLDPRGLNALWRTVLFTVLATTIELIIGLFVALLLDREFHGKRIARAIMLVPIVMTPIVVGLTWRFMFDPSSGMANYLLSLLHLGPVDWLGNPNVALFSVMIADIWQWTPFVVLLTMASLESLPGDPQNAARVDGAREWQVLWHITLPALHRALLVVALIRAIDSVKTFDIFYIMTRGGPALSTETLNLYGYISAFTNFDISYALTVAMVLTIFTNVALLLLYNLAFKAQARGAV
ncbi:carbohydrate ABC transporter permease [Rhizobium ruizarguesonis]|jgi:multiple sugar transport system permease protein|uniref:Sugar ABC transporter permease n=1 Tax=Rhizobium ruizarguesonis TaxID=2081791 RepID=A0ABY1X452_9HYPH|nr:sugar ABC transporter permease [Rhizobium ruizarguesonis]QND21405.1 sugar ABC transporter permease [Rhizobium leguminosarum bv. viciae]NEJ14106.1 ABC transporter permease subunit [Rhizobium ruizarguesonis]NEK28479.1 ABC transporter permease subunit [Rhizobium ruizarguesonis]TAU75016.1 sugar ABC transporter permease [Rhizobium ruizarguesonis]TAV14250.1 sugar ABC transporter permease [Rhizobium ruizarguesonis]